MSKAKQQRYVYVDIEVENGVVHELSAAAELPSARTGTDVAEFNGSGLNLDSLADAFLRWCGQQHVNFNLFILVTHTAETVRLLEQLFGEHLRFIGFPLEDAFCLTELFYVLATREVVPFTLDASLGSIAGLLGLNDLPMTTSLERARTLKHIMECMLELGVRDVFDKHIILT